MTLVKLPVAVVSTFLWTGFVCAISFMEAWLKFRAPGVTLPLGLGIGRIVFAALNKVEWVFAIAIVLTMLLAKYPVLTWKNSPFFIAVLLLVIQTAWLLPALDHRAQLHIDNLSVPPSNLHFYYVGAEAVKVICLGIFGISLFKSTSI